MTATQMQPTAWGGDPERAVDGNPDGNWGSSSVTHTDYLDQAWWQVDLGASKFVTSVDVFNRTDCCADRLSNFYVMTSTDGSTWTANYNYFNAGNPSSFLVNSQARYVKIQLAGTNYLSLAEVYVWGP
jgi:alpha-L-fucosidase 2